MLRASVFAFVIFFSAFASAQQPSENNQVASPAAQIPHACETCYALMSQQPSLWTVAFSPSYFHQNRENINPAFTSNGFSAPRADLFGLEIELRKQLHTGFQWGVEYLSAETDREQAANQANYRTTMLGLYLGYRLYNGGRFSIDLGTGLGVAASQLEVFSGTKNGRLTESALYLQPTLGFAYSVSRHLRLGLSGSYLSPYGQSEDIVGQDLVVRDIALQGFSAKVDLILGRF